jgi:amidophosphoribosyltransferase
LDVDGIRASIGADSLGYVSLDGLIAASEQPKNRLCRACFDGVYPIPLPDVVGNKHVLEGIGRSVSNGVAREADYVREAEQAREADYASEVDYVREAEQALDDVLTLP